MKPLDSQTRYWIESAALGPFSFRENRDFFTSAYPNGEVVTCHAKTYTAMIERGWVAEIA